MSGARQVGKSTLARAVAAVRGMSYVTLDDDTAAAAARTDPMGFLSGYSRPLVIDEVQRAPGLVTAIKRRVDADDAPGQYLLTGSADLFASPRAPEALTGRIEVIRLWPLTQSEVRGTDANIVDALFEGTPPAIEGAPVGRTAFTEIVLAGGYPEALRRTAGARRDRWFAAYLDASLGRDLREMSDALKLSEMPRLLRLLAAQAAGELSYRTLASRLEITRDTAQSYVHLLQLIHLTMLLPGWRPGLGAREVQRSKGYVVDSGVLGHLLNADDARVRGDDQVTGRMLENFVAMELCRLADVSASRPILHHYRQGRDEVDLVMERRSGAIVGVEVKAAATLRRKDWAPLERLRDARGEDFMCGVVVHTGDRTIPLGDRLWALPVSGLWDQAAR